MVPGIPDNVSTPTNPLPTAHLQKPSQSSPAATAIIPPLHASTVAEFPLVSTRITVPSNP